MNQEYLEPDTTQRKAQDAQHPPRRMKTEEPAVEAPERPWRARPRIDAPTDSRGTGAKCMGMTTHGQPGRDSRLSRVQEAMNIVARVSLPSRDQEWPAVTDGLNYPACVDAGWVNKFLHQVTAL